MTIELAHAETEVEKLRELQEAHKRALSKVQFLHGEIEAQLLRIFDAPPESQMKGHGSQILEFAETYDLYPRWLYGILETAASDCVDAIRPWGLLQPDPPPTTDNPEDHYKYAMAVLNSEGLATRAYRLQVQESLQKAEELATANEKDTTNPNRLMSLAYRWMKENLGIYYDIHTKHCWENY